MSRKLNASAPKEEATSTLVPKLRFPELWESARIFISPNGATHTSPEQRSGITATTPFPSPEGANHSPHP